MDLASSFFTKIPLMYRKNSILESVRKNPPPVDKNQRLKTALLTIPLRDTKWGETSLFPAWWWNPKESGPFRMGLPTFIPK
jgi:hypothetical protein